MTENAVRKPQNESPPPFHALGDQMWDSNANVTPNLYAQAFAGSRWLTLTGIFMLVDTVASLAGLAIDRTTVMGDPTWLKPFKFGISTALFAFTVAWMIGQLPNTPRFLLSLSKILGRIMAAALVLEIILIDMQAARHTSSHFNIDLPFDQRVFAVMGFGIALVLLSTALLFLITCFSRLADSSQAWAIRLSLLLALAGMGTGILMTLPTPQQLADLRANWEHSHRLPRSGAHTVGAPDSGPGLPITGWSADHGDLRIAHFVGLHAMQLLLLAWYLTRNQLRWSQNRQQGLIFGITASIAAAYAIALIQALHGQPILHPDTEILTDWAIWTITTGALILWAVTQNSSKAILKEGTR